MTQTKAELLQTRHQGDIRLGDADSTHYVGLKAPATVASNLVWSLPAADGSANQILKTDGSGALGWATDSATDSTKLPLAGGTMSGDINLGTNDITNGGTITGTFTGNLTGTASIATTVTVADESSDTSCNVLFATAATGNLAPKSGTNLTFNSDTGALTATSFVGALTGNVTGTIQTAAQTSITSLGTLTSLTVDGACKQVAEAVGALDIDLSTGNYFTKTISGNSTFTFSNPATSGTVSAFTLELTHSSGTVTWPASVKWNADTAPTLTTGKTHLFMFVTDDAGTRYRGSALVDYVN